MSDWKFNDPTCATCRWWRMGYMGDEHPSVGHTSGRCHFMPPITVDEFDQRVHHETRRDDSCGNWKASEVHEAYRTMNYSEYLQTDRWKNTRGTVLRRDGFACVLCASTENLNVHHRTYDRRGNEQLSDLITLCRDCHERFHEVMPVEGEMESSA